MSHDPPPRNDDPLPRPRNLQEVFELAVGGPYYKRLAREILEKPFPTEDVSPPPAAVNAADLPPQWRPGPQPENQPTDPAVIDALARRAAAEGLGIGGGH